MTDYFSKIMRAFLAFALVVGLAPTLAYAETAPAGPKAPAAENNAPPKGASSEVAAGGGVSPIA